ncbi:GNAT family N-acetyltransferase [Piscinibacter sp.]|uniref:GNAT family N-acetyltransferase n=1 Tax=Piscinibacter sp. TaxID=1903157 RepID=UPI0039E40CC9
MLSFRHAAPDDAGALASFASQAFSDAYRDLDDAREIAEYVAGHFNVPAVLALIGDPLATTVLAERGAELAGYAVIARTEPPTCVPGPQPIELARFYLADRFIGQGHGAQLMRAVHREASRLGAGTLWLGVYDRNVRAIGFYERSGFTRCGGKDFLFAGRVYVDPIYAAPVRHGA